MAGACVPFASESRELSAATSLQSEPSRDSLRVTGMETFTVRATARTNWIFVRLLTNQGLTGLGEASLGRQTALDKLPLFFEVGYLLHSGNPNLLRSGLAADTRGHRRAVVFGDQATALHPKTA